MRLCWLYHQVTLINSNAKLKFCASSRIGGWDSYLFIFIMLNCIFIFLLSSLLFGGKKNPPNSIGNLPWMCPPESLPDSMSLKNDEHNGQGTLQLQQKPASNWPANPCTTRKSSFFAPNPIAANRIFMTIYFGCNLCGCLLLLCGATFVFSRSYLSSLSKVLSSY